MACTELSAFRVATESLSNDIKNNPRLGRAMFWKNMIPSKTFVTGQGILRSTFTIKTSEPTDDQTQWVAKSLSQGILSACSRTWEDIGVGYYERTYGPKQRSFAGPIICKQNLLYQHAAEAFVDKYVLEMQRYIARVWEFTLRGDYINFVPWFVDVDNVITKYNGPNAIATAPRAYQGISYDSLQSVAQQLINVGAGAVDNGYVNIGNGGSIFPVEIDMTSSANILRSNSTIAEYAKYASMGKDGEGNTSLFSPIGANRVIGNVRHVPTDLPLRFDYNSGYSLVTPFKDVSVMDSYDDPLTDAYKNADFEAAVFMNPDVFDAEMVMPPNWPIRSIDGAPDPTSYNGTLEFIAGAERVCSPAEYDPLHEKGRHFATLEYAPAPNYPNFGAVLIYKRCPNTSNSIYCS